jgi:hypothetical protein
LYMRPTGTGLPYVLSFLRHVLLSLIQQLPFGLFTFLLDVRFFDFFS